MPAVSVVMYFHRVTPYLRPAVQSILQQTMRDLELVLVDNGTGAGLAPLSELGRDPRIRLISLPANAGIAGGHNAALAQAKGAFIALLDADDVALPRRLETQMAALQADPRLGLVSSRALQIDDRGAVIGREFALDGADEQWVFSAYTNPAPAPSYMGRAEVFRRFPFRADFRFASDYDFFARSAEAWSMRGIPEVLLHYRQHDQQTTAAHYAEQMRDAGVIRLLAARRRSGRPECLPDILAAARGWTTRNAGLAEVYSDLARHSLKEGFPLLAVYHARKLLSARRRPGDLVCALQILGAALRRETGDRGVLVRMFLGGPLRAHGLRRA